MNRTMFIVDKFALPWGEAQLCLPYVCFRKRVMTYSDPMVTYSHPKMTYSFLKVTYYELQWPKGNL